MITIVPSAMPAEREVVGDLAASRRRWPRMSPAARPTRLTGLAKSTRFSTQIFAPSRPIIP